MAEKSYIEAIRDALFEEMTRDPAVFLMGEDVRCNFFGTTGGFIEEFGLDRILDCPIGRPERGWLEGGGEKHRQTRSTAIATLANAHRQSTLLGRVGNS